jgi:localization factor PodJL
VPNETLGESQQPFGVHPSFGADSFAATAAHRAETTTNESFIAATRRSARESAASSASPADASGMFGWATQHSTESSVSENKSGLRRNALIVSLVLLIIAAVIAGKMLSGLFGEPHTAVAPRSIHNIAKHGTSAAGTGRFSTAQNGIGAPAASTNASATKSAPPSPDQAAQNPMGATYPIISAQAPSQTGPQATLQAKLNAPLEKLTALARSGNVMAEAVLGFDYLDGGNGVQVNEAEAARWLERAANQGNAVAAYRLGTLYERGHGVPTDSAQAMQWYTVAAKQGNRKAMHNLAVAFAEGTGVPKNMSFAVQWFTRAANLGLSDSQFNLAVLYERGMGVPQSLTEAYKWYSIAAAQGDTESKTRVDALATQLTPADKQAAQHAADTFQPKPLDKTANNPPASTDIIGN